MYASRKSKREDDKRDTKKPILTVKEACLLLNIHDNTLRRWSNQGVVKPCRIGPRGERRFKRDDILALLAQEKTAVPPANRSRRGLDS
ncbi:MAG: helix-turn-helix domain-containing protein [Dehalococcoidia bacterium]